MNFEEPSFCLRLMQVTICEWQVVSLATFPQGSSDCRVVVRVLRCLRHVRSRSCCSGLGGHQCPIRRWGSFASSGPGVVLSVCELSRGKGGSAVSMSTCRLSVLEGWELGAEACVVVCVHSCAGQRLSELRE
eukprot:1006652-Rhodomonas_salina.2